MPPTAGEQECASATMGEYRIRSYEDGDYEAARTIVSEGITEHVPAGFWLVLRSPQTHGLLLGLFLATYGISSSFLFSFAVVSALLATGWIRIKAVWRDYVEAALEGDMLDIQRTYLDPTDCHFWVVERGREVVGTVAVLHPEDPALQGRALELKRMSVKKGHRGRGLSKALTKAVLRFAQEHGYKEVVLSTTMVQYAAQRLYEGMGFQRVKELCPFLSAKLLQFYIYVYRYEIPGPR
nr:PREDICTED: putative N-acetyltransferase 8B [Anolis carolinensis]|eukprot:XP_003228730.2 PREDICTED: putative N-acetyltransferase 8B [Anolis carolinensis]